MARADWWVYLAVDGRDRALFVGVTPTGNMRLASRGGRSVAGIRIEHYESEGAARARERSLVEELSPPYNQRQPQQRQGHVFPGRRRIPPEEVDRLEATAEAKGLPVMRCACGCGESLIGRRPNAVWATDACRKRAERRSR